MTSTHANNVDLSDVSPDVLVVAERTQKAGWDFEWLERPGPDEVPLLIIWIPNGRDKRRQAVGSLRAKRLANMSFEQFRLLGGYLAINNSSAGYIEAIIRPSGRMPVGQSILEIPGVQIIESATEDSDDSAEEVLETRERSRIKPGDQWRLDISDDKHSWSIELSRMSDEFLALVDAPEVRMRTPERRTTLKIRGVVAPRHEEALRRLEDISGAILFDLDLRYGVAMELARYSERRSRSSYLPEPVTSPPSLPRTRYAPEALSLYRYGRSAVGMPLLQFLAYYQVLEFFFPMHFRHHLLRRIRQEIINPRFDVTDDAHVARLLALTATGRSGYGSEREQLKATVQGCIDETTLKDFFHEAPERFGVLLDKKAIKGVPVIDENNRGSSLVDQVVERIYAIRCRVVHAKADGGEASVDLLLPGGPEAAVLTADVAVLQFLAQKTIVAGGSPLP